MLESSFRILLQVIDPLAMTVGVRGFACSRIQMGQARHVPILLVGLGNAGSGSYDLVASLLAPAGSATSTAAAASALASLLENHSDHIGSATPIVFRRVFPLVVVIIVLLLLGPWYRYRLHNSVRIILRRCDIACVVDHLVEGEGAGVELDC